MRAGNYASSGFAGVGRGSMSIQPPMNTPPNREVALFSAALELPASERAAYLRDLAVAAVLMMRRCGRDLRAVDRDNTDLHQPGLRTQPQHLGEQVTDRGLMTHAKPGDRRVIQWLVRGDHPKRHILPATPLNPSRR